MTRVTVGLLLVVGLGVTVGCGGGVNADSVPRVNATEQRYDDLVEKYHDLTAAQLLAETPKRAYLDKLSFDPAAAKFYSEAVEYLQLTDREQQLLRGQGLVSVDHDQPYSFGTLYHAVYSGDLPVLVTTDSILHAMHRSYDDVLKEMETSFFTPVLEEVLGECHEQLATEAPSFGATAANYRDVDLYLTVALNLLRGAGAPHPAGQRVYRGLDAWEGTVLVNSKLGQDEEVKEILHLVQSLKFQDPLKDEFTIVYGGSRPIDYSQFQPRGHYTKTTELKRYFRAMMWLGRADTGWNILPPDRQSGITSDSPRELRNAVLLTQLLETTGAIKPLRQMADVLDFMVGDNDSLTVLQMQKLMKQRNLKSVGDLASGRSIEAFQKALLDGDMGTQRIRSQVVLSDPRDLYQVPPPSIFQVFGQRFAIDSFVLSKVVFDSIIFEGQKVKRFMPTGMDVMVALGNDSVLPLLSEELTKFPYAANLKASQEFVRQYQQKFWRSNLYNTWLDSLRTLSADQSKQALVPEAMRTAAWQRKQLQTQLASWSELRHDTVLYAKQSYTAEARCEYPTGYIEPYPETYARVKHFAEEAARRIEASDFGFNDRNQAAIKTRQIKFFKQMAEILSNLERLARKELAAEPFTDEEQLWLKKLIDLRARGSGGATYSGWYCQLFYPGPHHSAELERTIVDVHTDSNTANVLEIGVGDCNFLVVAIDHEKDRMIYVGPAYSYYEFQQPAGDRLTDEKWEQMLDTDSAPPRPAWTEVFQAPTLKRELAERP
jgi:hypothetical protein